jgi:competence protein ComEC
MLAVAGAWMAGIALGRWMGSLWLWGPLAVAAAGVMGWWLWRGRDWPARCWGLVAVVAIGAGWYAAHTHYVAAGHISQYLPSEQSVLATVRGRLITDGHLASARRGPFGHYSYKPPTSMARLSVEALHIDGRWRSVHGSLLLKVGGAGRAFERGQRIEASGWLGRIHRARNPAGGGYRQWLARQGMAGRLSLASHDNYERIGQATGRLLGMWRSARQALRDAARQSLAFGMDRHSQAHQLLATVLLGERVGAGSQLREQFKSVGLAHLLAISGAHLGILLGLVWMVSRVIGLGPRTTTGVLLMVLALYWLIVPARVPIMRASIMAGMLLAGRGLGRQANALAMLALAAIVVLLWRPGELFSPGFQLSFTAVAALIVFVKPVSHWLWPPRLIEPEHVPLGQKLMRAAVDYVAVSIVALLVVSPLVAYHFHTVHPLGAVMSVLALPAFAAVLGVGYLKIVAGLLWPSVSLVLSGPAAWAGATLAGLVEQANHWPGTQLHLLQQPSLVWVIAALGLTLALLSGRFAGRRWAFAASVLVLGSWTWLNQQPGARGELSLIDQTPAATLRMLAVGDGSCYLLTTGGRTLMFDCGSRSYLDVGSKTIVPALRQIEVGAIDRLMLSHPDLDHFSGALTLARRWPVERVLAPPPLLREAAKEEYGPAGHLAEQLRATGLRIEPIERGWQTRFGDARLTALWPPKDYQPEHKNDGSLVLLIEVAGRRILLNGDVQEAAIDQLLQGKADLHAAVTDLPHHGSFVENAEPWLDAVGPELVLQSSGPVQPTTDHWRAVLRQRGIPRLISEQVGMVTVRVHRDGTIETNTFRPPAAGTRAR